MSEKYRTFGEKVKAVREQQGVSIEDAASRSGLTTAQWEGIEANEITIKMRGLWDMAFALDVAVIDLIETK